MKSISFQNHLTFGFSLPIICTFSKTSSFLSHSRSSSSSPPVFFSNKLVCSIATNTFHANSQSFPNPSISVSPIFNPNFHITILGGNIQYTHFVNHIITDVGGKLSDWKILAPHAFDTNVYIPFDINIDDIRSKLRNAGDDIADIIIQPDSIAKTKKRLVVFDLDSTLIMQETIDELAAELNVETQVKSITERAMNGEIGFRDALKERVELLKGLPLYALDGVKTRAIFTTGAKDLVKVLSKIGCHTAVVSGGFHFLADHVKDVLGLDFSFANRLEVDQYDVLTGRTIGEVVDSEYKQNTLLRLTKQFGLEKDQVVAVGDGSNDLLMMHHAGLGVAFNAKPYVRNRAKCWINQPSLMNVLYLLGYSNSQIEQIINDNGNA